MGGVTRRLGGYLIGHHVAHYGDVLAVFGQIARGNPSVAAVVPVAAQHDEARPILGPCIIHDLVVFVEQRVFFNRNLLFRHALRPVGEEASGPFHEQCEGCAALRYLAFEAHHVGHV